MSVIKAPSAVKDELIKERDRLKARLASIEADYRSGLSPDSSEQAVELENREVLDEIARTTAEELDKVEEQLSQIGKDSR